MAEFSSAMSALALDLITFFGESLTFTKTASSGYSTSTLAYGTNTNSTFTVVGAPLELSSVTRHKIEKEGVAISQDMKEVYIPSGTYTPALSDKVAVGSASLRVLQIQEFRTQGVVCAYMLVVGV